MTANEQMKRGIRKALEKALSERSSIYGNLLVNVDTILPELTEAAYTAVQQFFVIGSIQKAVQMRKGEMADHIHEWKDGVCEICGREYD